MTDTFTDDLAAHLQARRDEVAAATTPPTLDALFDRPTPLTTVASAGHRRRNATIALAAAAVMLLVVGVLALTRDGSQRVSTLPAGQVRRLAGAGTPFLLPPGDDAKVEFNAIPEASREIVFPTAVNGTLETLVSGAAGDTARLLTLAAAGPRDDTMMDPFSSLRRSDMFDPAVWFDRLDTTLEASGDQTWSDPTGSIPGSDRAVLVTEPDRPSILAIQRGTLRIALFGNGLTDTELISVAASLQFSDAAGGVTFGDVPDGLVPLVPRSTRPPAFGTGYSARSKAASIGVAAVDDAAFDAAMAVHSTGAFAPRWTVLRGGPDWVLQLVDFPRNSVGVRDGGWVSLHLPKGGGVDGPVALAAFDMIRVVDIDTFGAALGSGTVAREAQVRNDTEKTVDRIEDWGGWLPRLPAGYDLEDYSLIGSNPPTIGGLDGLVPLWAPATGATLGVGDAPSEDVERQGPPTQRSVRLETAVLGGRETELRSWPMAPDDVYAVFDDGEGQRVQTVGSGLTVDQVRAYVDSIRRLDDGTWSATPPPGFEPIPLARPADAAATRDVTDRNGGIDGAELNFSIPDSPERVAVDVHEPDLTVAADMIAQFFSTGPVERMTTGNVTWYRLRSTFLDQHRVAIPGTTTRPTVIVASSALTDDQLFEIASSLRQASDAEVEQVFAPLLDG